MLTEAFMYRHHPQTQDLASSSREGAVGRLALVTRPSASRSPALGNVRALPELDGGALMDVGCYCISGIRILAGEPDPCAASR